MPKIGLGSKGAWMSVAFMSQCGVLIMRELARVVLRSQLCLLLFRRQVWPGREPKLCREPKFNY